MALPPVIRFLIAGQLRREFIITPAGKPVLDIQGGNLLYAAAGCSIWEPGIGLLGRVGENYSHEWLDQIAQKGFDSRGIHTIAEVLDQRSFFAYTDIDTCHTDNPVSHFVRLGMPFPKNLLGFSSQAQVQDSRTSPGTFTIRLSDIPGDYFDASAVHLCPLDFLSHTLLPPALRQGSLTTITIDPSASYMNPIFWNAIPDVLKGITAFLPSEEKLRSLFQGRTNVPWEMADALADYGCEIIVINRGMQGQLLYEHATHSRWSIPMYPGRTVDPTGAGDAFCGGFLAGYHSTYNALEGVLTGNISASLAMEGSGPFYGVDALPGLAKARLEVLRGMVHKA
ncbi:MAG TPA: carbohydrate kinase family protein [Anaerolineaceae bacterium]